MTKKGKKRVIALSAAFVMLFYIHYTRNHRRKETCFVINKGNITYSGGTIYIGSKKYIESLGEVGPGDVLVIDERRSEDPNLKVLDSYKIIRPSVRNEIIDALLYYEDKYPTNWDRTKPSMVNEWDAHNWMRYFGIREERTTDTDFNNADEKQYTLRIKK